MVGPAIGGLLAHPELGTLGFQIPLFAAAGFGLLSALAVFAFVRESRPERREGPEPHRTEVLRAALAHPIIARVMIISFVVISGFAGIEATYGLWTEYKFGWGPREIGFAFMGIGVLGAFCQAVVTGALVRRHGEAQVLTAGLAAMWIGMVFQFTASAWPMAMVGFAFVCFGQSICFPCLTALISQASPPERQGETLGLNMSNMALARIGGPVFAGQLFSLVDPGAAFVVTAILIVPAAFMAVQIMRRMPRAA
jgi:predicted MFS family arabinose efflux permease